MWVLWFLFIYFLFFCQCFFFSPDGFRDISHISQNVKKKTQALKCVNPRFAWEKKNQKTKQNLSSTGEEKTFAQIQRGVFKAVAGVAVSSVGGIIHPGSAQKYAYHLFHFIPAPPLMFNVSVLMASPAYSTMAAAKHQGTQWKTETSAAWTALRTGFHPGRRLQSDRVLMDCFIF